MSKDNHIKITIKKDRNPYVSLAMNRKAGSHTKSNKSIRQKENNLLKKELNKKGDQKSPFLFII